MGGLWKGNRWEQEGESAGAEQSRALQLSLPASLQLCARLAEPEALPLCPPRAHPQCSHFTVAPQKVLALGSCQNVPLLCPPGQLDVKKEKGLLEKSLSLVSEQVADW